MSEIDLMPFCAIKPDGRYDMRQPFSRDEYTYATNAHIGVRVPKRDGVAVADGPPIEKIFPEPLPAVTPVAFAVLPPLPEPEEEDCDQCDASGKAHDCPNCTCECSGCDGVGTIKKTECITIALRGALFDLKYVRLIAALPSLLLPAHAPKTAPMYFRFDGGDGVLQPMSSAVGKAVPGEAK